MQVALREWDFDARFIQGKGNYVDDHKLPGMLHGDFLRSSHAHARITSINADAAKALPGVVAVLTADDLKPLNLHWIPTLAGDTMAASLAGADGFRDPDEDALAAGVERCRTPLGRPPGDLDEIREGLFDLMWEDVGIVRSESGLERAGAALAALETELDALGVAGEDLVYNLTWHDWLNLKSLILVGRAITAAAMAREDSRGAHFLSDHPETGDLAASRFTSVRLDGGDMVVHTEPVRFTRVEPGETLLADSAAE